MPTVPFTATPLDRADTVRKDPEAVDALWQDPGSEVLICWRGKPLVRHEADRTVPVVLSPDALAHRPAVRLFLGMEGTKGVLAASLDPSRDPPTDYDTLGTFVDLRPAVGQMDPRAAAMVGTARSIFTWHRTHRFCSRCGETTSPGDAGWKRVCDACGGEHFPRVDPVVIMLIVCGDRTLLGRSPDWPPTMFSCLAGFVEPGETLAAAAQREAEEEASVTIDRVTFLMSQPWPFPSSLMIGLLAEAPDPDFAVDGVELAEARWFSRDEVPRLLDGTHPEAAAPPPLAVAHHLLRWWVEGDR